MRGYYDRFRGERRLVAAGKESAPSRCRSRRRAGQDDGKTEGCCGYDAAKPFAVAQGEVGGRKPHVVVDTMGLMGADRGYAGRLVRVIDRWRHELGRRLEIVKRTDDAKGFVVLPERWIVERGPERSRTVGWIGRYRRLSEEHEGQTHDSQTMTRIAMIHLMLQRTRPAGTVQSAPAS